MNLRRLSWIDIDDDYQVLFMRKRGGDVFFEPGCWAIEGQDDRVTLANKIKEDLGIELDIESMVKCASFKAQAYGKPPDTMIEFVGYFAHKLTVITEVAAKEVEIGRFGYGDEWPTSDGGAGFKYMLTAQGLI